MNLDKNSNGNEYKIRSLYFDNLDNKALIEKIIGINNREKFRIRFYNDDYSFIKLEKKSKINGVCYKTSEIITMEECKEIQKGNIDFLKNSNKSLFIELYSKMKNQLLRPKTIVDYVREAYVYPISNVRITFDKKVKTGLLNTNMFEKNLPTVSAIDESLIILEVKYDEFLPEIIQDIIQTNESRQSSISKYAAARRYF